MTSSSPAAGRVLAAAARARGIGVLDAPVGGGVPAARTGTLQLFVGGDIALLERHRRLLEVLADPQRIAHVGGHGAGYLVKLLVNLLWFGQAVATAEALLLARRAGLDLDVLRRALGDSAAVVTVLTRADMPGLGLIGMPPLGQPVLRLQDDRLRYKGQRWRWCWPAPPSMPAMRPA